MNGLKVVEDANGYVQSVEPVPAATQRCPSCHRDLPFSAYATDGRTANGRSPTCLTCRAKGIMTYADAKAGKAVSPWSQGLNSNLNSKKEVEPKITVALKTETSEQKVMSCLTLVTEALDTEERMTLVRMLKALHGAP